MDLPDNRMLTILVHKDTSRRREGEGGKCQ